VVKTKQLWKLHIMFERFLSDKKKQRQKRKNLKGKTKQ
jgi:hypothetical protein